MNKYAFAIIFFLLPLVGHGANKFTPMTQFHLYTGSPTGVPITELSRSWGYATSSPVNTMALSTAADGWESSPNLTVPPYSLACTGGGTVKAVMLIIKAKVKTVTWSIYRSLGNIQIALRSPDNQGQNNEVVHAFSSKEVNQGNNLLSGGLDTEDLNFNTVPVGVVNGVFHLYTNATLNAYASIERTVYLAGFWC